LIRSASHCLRSPSLRAGVVLFACVVLARAELAGARDAAPYFPPPGDAWSTVNPAEAGIDPARLSEAVAFAQANEVPWPRDVRAQIEKDTANEPYPEILGLVKPRGGQNGIVLKGGRIVAEWGDTRRVDLTFSVAKSYLSVVAGLAYDDGLLGDPDQPVGARVKDGGYDAAHNAPITWTMHLQHTSEWQGTLWDKPDVADRRRGYFRTLQKPGTFWEYNDVRVNRLALSLLRLYERPLPEVLKARVMDPIGASDSWVWHGYLNSYVDVGGRRIQSVSGGSHWGGGFWASTRDHARFGYLVLRNGEWDGRPLLSADWIRRMTTPADIAGFQGYLWWLSSPTNPALPNLPPGSFAALGSGGNMVFVDPSRDLVAVVRWMDIPKLDGFVQRLAAAVPPAAAR
jgi:CubicO group peptidase (beta-lactamase class C family)